MKTHRGLNKICRLDKIFRLWSLLLAGALALVPASVALLAYLAPDQPGNLDTVRATYADGALHVSIPQSGTRSGAGI